MDWSWSHRRTWGMKSARHLGMFLLAFLCGSHVFAQSEGNNAPGNSAPAKAAPANTAAPPNPWEFDLSVTGNIVPNGQSYASPTFTADRDTLHLEARYNYEAQQTASLWFGYNLSVGKKLDLEATPMIGGVFGKVNGIAPGVEVTVTYKKLQLYSANEYIFDTGTKAGDFFYTWTQLTYSPVPWFSAGYVVQRTRAYATSLDIQRGLRLQFTHEKVTFSTQIFNIRETDPVVMLAIGYSFSVDPKHTKRVGETQDKGGAATDP
jgi:hypothetical protein